MKPTNTILLLGAGAALIAQGQNQSSLFAMAGNRISGVRKNYSIKHSVGFL